MRRSSALLVALFVVMTSCGSLPDVPEDTEHVAAQPPVAPAAEPVDEPVIPSAPLAPVPATTGPAAPPAARVGFVGDRFILVGQEDEPSFSVFDRARGETFRVLGAPLGDAMSLGNRFLDFGLAHGAPQWSLHTGGDSRMLVKSVGGVQLVDLADHGHMIAAWRGVPAWASLAPDGRTFSVTTASAVHIVRADDGAVATFATRSTPFPTWGDTKVYWTADGAFTRVDRETLEASIVRAPDEKAQFAASHEGTVVAIASKGNVLLHVAGTSAPILQIASPDETAQLTVDRDGTSVVWIERAIDEKTFSDKGHLHVIDVGARSHVRFPMTNSGCGNAPETIEAVRDGQIITDPSCSIGCPSVRWTHRSVSYDARTGKIVRDVSHKETASWNEEQGSLGNEVDAAVTREHVEPKAMLAQERRGSPTQFVVERASGLSIVPLTAGATPLDLEDSAGASVTDLTFSSDGTVLAGVAGGRMRAWDGATGRALLR